MVSTKQVTCFFCGQTIHFWEELISVDGRYCHEQVYNESTNKMKCKQLFNKKLLENEKKRK